MPDDYKQQSIDHYNELKAMRRTSNSSSAIARLDRAIVQARRSLEGQGVDPDKLDWPKMNEEAIKSTKLYYCFACPAKFYGSALQKGKIPFHYDRSNGGIQEVCDGGKKDPKKDPKLNEARRLLRAVHGRTTLSEAPVEGWAGRILSAIKGLSMQQKCDAAGMILTVVRQGVLHSPDAKVVNELSTAIEGIKRVVDVMSQSSRYDVS